MQDFARYRAAQGKAAVLVESLRAHGSGTLPTSQSVGPGIRQAGRPQLHIAIDYENLR